MVTWKDLVVAGLRACDKYGRGLLSMGGQWPCWWWQTGGGAKDCLKGPSLKFLFAYLICMFRPKHSRVVLAVIKNLSKCERMEIKIWSFQKRNACIIWQDWSPCLRERSQKFPFFMLLYVKHCSIKFAFKLSHKSSLMQRMRLISSWFLYNKHACWFVSDVF